MTRQVESVFTERTNGALIERVAGLWIRPDDLVLDVTYGRGRWWTRYRPERLVAHDATFSPRLVSRFIESMCPRRVCRTCGKPSRRVTQQSDDYAATRAAIKTNGRGAPSDDAIGKATGSEGTRFAARESGFTAENVTVDWTSCGCPDADGVRLDGYHTGTGWRPGLVLDPFAGSGTTLMVAHGLSRDSVGIDIDERNLDLARGRLGMFLVGEQRPVETVAATEYL